MQLAGSRDGEEMWKCESVKIWKYENMEMPSSVVIASSYDAGGKNARQFNRFVDQKLKFLLFNVATFANYLKPYASLGKLLHRNLDFVNEILARFGFGSLCIIGGNACRGAEDLVRKTAAADSLNRQCYAYFYATRGKLDDSVFKVGFHANSVSYFHNFILAYFHISTFNKSPVVQKGHLPDSLRTLMRLAFAASKLRHTSRSAEKSMQPRLRAFSSAVRTKRIAASPDKTGMLLIARAISELPFAAYCSKNRRDVLGIRQAAGRRLRH